MAELTYGRDFSALYKSYRRTLRTLLLKTMTFVWMLSPVDYRMALSIAKTWLALMTRVLIS